MVYSQYNGDYPIAPWIGARNDFSISIWYLVSAITIIHMHSLAIVCLLSSVSTSSLMEQVTSRRCVWISANYYYKSESTHFLMTCCGTGLHGCITAMILLRCKQNH